MATTYQDLEWQGTQGLQELVQGEWPTLQEWAYKIYLKWIGDDPVDEVEIDRNNAVAEIQGNRNLFIDYPYLAEYIWGDSIDRPFDPYTSVTTASDDYRYGSQTPPAVTTPTFSVTSGSYIAPLTVEITCATTGATIYYTTDGTEPTKASTPYNSPLTLNATTTLKAIAVKRNRRKQSGNGQLHAQECRRHVLLLETHHRTDRWQTVSHRGQQRNAQGCKASGRGHKGLRLSAGDRRSGERIEDNTRNR